MNSPLFTLYTSARVVKQSDAHFEKTVLSSDKRTFAEAQALADYNYNGCYNADDDFADYMPSVKAVRIA